MTTTDDRLAELVTVYEVFEDMRTASAMSWFSAEHGLSYFAFDRETRSWDSLLDVEHDIAALGETGKDWLRTHAVGREWRRLA